MAREDAYALYGESPASTRLLRIFLAAAIIDNGGNLPISRKSLSELSDEANLHRGFQIIASPGEDHSMELSLEWYD